MSDFQSTRLDQDGKPLSRTIRPKAFGNHPLALLKDLLGIPVLVGLGCLLQLAASLTRLWYLPALLLIVAPIVKTAMIHYGFLENPDLQTIIKGRVSASVPRDYRDGQPTGEFAVFLLGFRSNSPLGLLHPVARATASSFFKMIKHLEDNPEENGYLGVSNYLGTKRASSNTLMNVFYFRSQADVTKFSNGFHLKYWKQFNAQTPEQREMVQIWHEAFTASQVDAIYVNTEPTGMCNLWEKDDTRKEEDGDVWINGMHRVDKKSSASQRMKGI